MSSGGELLYSGGQCPPLPNLLRTGDLHIVLENSDGARSMASCLDPQTRLLTHSPEASYDAAAPRFLRKSVDRVRWFSWNALIDRSPKLGSRRTLV